VPHACVSNDNQLSVLSPGEEETSAEESEEVNVTFEFECASVPECGSRRSLRDT